MFNTNTGYSLLTLLLTLWLVSCSSEQTENPVEVDSAQTEKPIVTFAVAGHIYGNSDHYTNSIYPPFLKKLKDDHKKHHFQFLFLTGDVLFDTSETTFNYVKAQLDGLGIKWFVAPGNHDTAWKWGTDTLSKVDIDLVRLGKNEFFVLNSANPGWTVGELEAFMLRNILPDLNPDSTDNIFVFTHQLWWERNTPKEFRLDSLRPNSFALYDGPSDFWKDIFPYFDSTGIETWFFAGDLGADAKLESYYEDHYNQFHFYASGMGGGKSDNYLIVEVYQNGRVDIEKVNF